MAPLNLHFCEGKRDSQRGFFLEKRNYNGRKTKIPSLQSRNIYEAVAQLGRARL